MHQNHSEVTTCPLRIMLGMVAGALLFCAIVMLVVLSFR
jgi:hypothetical protein